IAVNLLQSCRYSDGIDSPWGQLLTTPKKLTLASKGGTIADEIAELHAVDRRDHSFLRSLGLLKAPDFPHFDCRDHIRVIQSMGNGDRLYVCGTNAHNPKDWVINANLTHLSRNIFVHGIGMGIAKCPYDPTDNSTAVWVEHGNPGNLPGLYSEPNFVGSSDIGDFVLFFFETAVEYINFGKSVYSRVARICKKDTGGRNILTQNWVTYLKARLNCSIPGEFPFYFSE
ncbi:hypothetical protein YQE_02810, partial [Dendroctonus ponderosae]